MNHLNNGSNSPEEPDSDIEPVKVSPNRRRFTRNAVTGSAVFFSLANRPVWSQTCVEQVSASFLNSLSHDSHDPDGLKTAVVQSQIDEWAAEDGNVIERDGKFYKLTWGEKPGEPGYYCQFEEEIEPPPP